MISSGELEGGEEKWPLVALLLLLLLLQIGRAHV